VVEPSLYAVATLYVCVAVAYLFMQKHHQSRHVAAPRPAHTGPFWPSVDVVLPCYNERPELLAACCRALERQDYPGELHVYLVDDGSQNRHALLPIYLRYQDRSQWTVRLLDDNRGKRNAQDIAFRVGHGDLVVTVDSDTVLERDGIRRLVGPFDDPLVGAVTGDVRASNAERTWLTDLIDERYRLLFEQERAAQSQVGTVLCCSGPFSAYRRSILEQIWDAYLSQTFFGRPCVAGDDLHLTILVLASGCRSLYEPSARARTHVPETLRSYVRQQVRWNRSFYRELRPTVRLLRKRHPYVTIDVTARFLLPLLLAVGTSLAVGHAVTGLLQHSRALAAAVAVAVMYVSSVGLLASKTRRARFVLVYGLIYASLLIPARLWALATLRHDAWVTRRLGRSAQRGAAQVTWLVLRSLAQQGDSGQ
jgi:N-acetylglucosaminyltransferase